MFDASTSPYGENLVTTRAVTASCRREGVWVEAELGGVGGKDGAHAPGVRTDPDEVRAFVEATGVDALAVAVGSSHAMRTRDASLDFALISRLRDAVDVPLVLHCSSGVGEADLAKAVEAGMTKMNVSTHLNALFTRSVRDHLDTHPETVDPRAYLGRARDAVGTEVPASCHSSRGPPRPPESRTIPGPALGRARHSWTFWLVRSRVTATPPAEEEPAVPSNRGIRRLPRGRRPGSGRPW